MPTDRGMVPAVSSAARIIERLSERGEARASELADELVLNRSTCHGILKTLTAYAFLEFEEDSKLYRIGPVLTALGARAWEHADHIRAARPLLREFAYATGYTTFIAQHLPSQEFIVLAQAEGTGVVRVTVGIGERFPPGSPALTKSYLATLSPSAAERVFAEIHPRRFTDRSIMNRPDFLAEVDQVREEGWAYSRGEYYTGTNAVVTAVDDPHGHVQLFLCSLALGTELPIEELEETGRALASLATRVTAAIRDGAGARA